MIFFVDLIVNVFDQLRRDLVGFDIAGRILMGRSRDDQRCSSFIDQNVVDFVNDRERQGAL